MVRHPLSLSSHSNHQTAYQLTASLGNCTRSQSLQPILPHWRLTGLIALKNWNKSRLTAALRGNMRACSSCHSSKSRCYPRWNNCAVSTAPIAICQTSHALIARVLASSQSSSSATTARNPSWVLPRSMSTKTGGNRRRKWIYFATSRSHSFQPGPKSPAFTDVWAQEFDIAKTQF